MALFYGRLGYFGIGAVFSAWMCWIIMRAYTTNFEIEKWKRGELTLLQECQKNISDSMPHFGIILARFPPVILLVAVSFLFAWPLPLAMIVRRALRGATAGFVAGIRNLLKK